MARIQLSMYFTNNIVKLIQSILLPVKSKYTFLEEIEKIYNYSLFFICKKIK